MGDYNYTSEIARVPVYVTSAAADPVILSNLGVNDIGSVLPDQGTWQNAYIAQLDAYHTKWPNVKVYLAYPWRQGFDGGSATIHGWVNNVIAARSTFTFPGPDEAVVIKGSDNGASETIDGIHYSALGGTLIASAWQTALGF